MHEGIDRTPALTSKEQDIEWVRKIWTQAGEAWAKKLSQDTGTYHSTEDALELMADATNYLIDEAEKSGTEEGKRLADILRRR